mmetsp:Transcript_529/g.1242  ORF Transcript_529/g.1242 Transcript_529/m.1242 type:complete len:100 (+) Transcript_529:984-1283(+)
MVLAQTPDGSEFGLNSDADVDVNAAADDDASAPLLETNTEAKYLLVIEKQGIFLRLCEDSFHLRLPCILVTGCGYPDIATRSLVRCISDRHPVMLIPCL